MNLLCEVIAVGVLHEIYFSNYFMLMTAVVYIAFNVALIILMLKSKKHVDNVLDITVIEN
jgi:predicted membrane protein